MAYNRSPQMSTYDTKTVKLIQEWNTRDSSGTKDNDTLNCFYETVKNRTTQENDFHVVSRDGSVAYPYVPTSTNIRGIHYWEDVDRLFIAYDSSIALVVGSTGAFVSTITPGWATGTTEIGFTEFNLSTGTVLLVATDGTLLITLDNVGTVAPSVSPDIPVPHVPKPLFLDGYIFLIKTGTADIYNSDLDAPLAYTAGSYITAEMLPDKLLQVTRLANYIVAFGSSSIEYFWDVGNATASPLQRNDTPVKIVGYLGGMAHWKNRIYFVGNTDSTAPTLFMLEDFKIEDVGSPPLRRYTEHYTSFTGSVLSMGGHDFYVLHVGTKTYMMDLETKLWTRIAYKQQTNFPIKYSLTLPLAGYGYTSLFYLEGTTTLGTFQSTAYMDSGVDFTPTVVTDSDAFDNYKRKFGSLVSFLADRPTNTSYLSVSWSDDDYQTFSTERTVALNNAYPHLTALGSFRKRAHKIVHHGDARMRIKSLDININMGGR